MTTETKIYQSALTLLAMREHSAGELVKKLQAKGFEEPAIQHVIQKLQQENKQSDERFCEVYIRSRLNKGYGPLRIKMELSEKHLAKELINKVINESSAEWPTALKKAYVKHAARKTINGLPERVKCMRFLQYRGFAIDQIKKIVQCESEE